MEQFSSLWEGLARSVSIKKRKISKAAIAQELAQALEKEARKNEFMLTTSGIVSSSKSGNFASMFSKQGKKGVNQDSFIVWEEFGCEEDIIFCGIFDGHGPWGHVLAKRVRNSLPFSLLCNWKDTSALAQAQAQTQGGQSCCPLGTWKESYLKTYASIDRDLEQHTGLDSFYSGSTSLTIVKQGDAFVIANVGDSRAVLATVSPDGSLAPVQLTEDSKPNLPQEAERISKSKGRVLCFKDEPGVYRVWRPDGEAPGLAISRAFGDYCMKDYGLISVPEVTQRQVTSNDQFVILATDGVWDVLSNIEAIQIVSSAPDREKSAKALAKQAALAWKRKKRSSAMDDISAICLFFNAPPS